jgi:Ca-activated chloride channel family protein
MTLRFVSPGWFVLFVLLPFLIWFYMGRIRPAFRFSAVGLLKGVDQGWHLRLRHLPFILKMVAFCSLVCALARPQIGYQSTEVISSGIDIMLAVDSSGSMRALDLDAGSRQFNRLEAVKSVVRDFVDRRISDRIGMVVFGTEAFLQCPLTLDHGALLALSNAVQIGAAGENTAVGSALGLATKRLKDVPSKSKIVILLTDGTNNAGAIDPQTAAQAAAALGVKVYTIAVGTLDEAPFPVRDPLLGIERLVYQKTPVDEESLRAIAATTGGRFYRATDLKELKTIYGTIDALEKTERKVREHANYDERYAPFVWFALVALLVGLVMSETRWRVFP